MVGFEVLGWKPSFLGQNRTRARTCALARLGARPHPRRDPRRGLSPWRTFCSVFVWGFLEWHHIRDIKRGWLVNFGRIWRVFCYGWGLGFGYELWNPFWDLPWCMNMYACMSIGVWSWVRVKLLKKLISLHSEQVSTLTCIIIVDCLCAMWLSSLACDYVR